jgi:hypothetical protein
MTKIMDAGAVALSAVGNARLPQEPAEILADVASVSGCPAVPGKNQSPPVRPTTRAW